MGAKNPARGKKNPSKKEAKHSAGGSKTAKLLGHLGAIASVSAWGMSFLCTKVLMADGGYSPVEMYVYRFAAAYILLLLMTFRKLFANNWRDELNLLICGMCAGSLYFITENYALTMTTTGNVSLLSSVSPIFVTILMAVVFKQAIKLGTAAGSLIAFAGVFCIIFSSGESLEFNPAGDLLALSAALCWAIYSIAVKSLIPLYSTLFITRKLFFYGVLTALPLLFMQHEPLHFAQLFSMSDPKLLLNFLFLVLFCSAGAYIIWGESMKRLGPVTTNNYIYGQPLVTMIAAYFFLGEKILLLGYIGCILIIGGLIIADKWNPTVRPHRK